MLKFPIGQYTNKLTSPNLLLLTVTQQNKQHPWPMNSDTIQSWWISTFTILYTIKWKDEYNLRLIKRYYLPITTSYTANELSSYLQYKWKSCKNVVEMVTKPAGRVLCCRLLLAIWGVDPTQKLAKHKR